MSELESFHILSKCYTSSRIFLHHKSTPPHSKFTSDSLAKYAYLKITIFLSMIMNMLCKYKFSFDLLTSLLNLCQWGYWIIFSAIFCNDCIACMTCMIVLLITWCNPQCRQCSFRSFLQILFSYCFYYLFFCQIACEVYYSL